MNSRTIKSPTFLTFAALCLITLVGPVLGEGQIVAGNRCTHAKGTFIEEFVPPAQTAGTVTNGGFLNGTTETVYDPAYVFTPEPGVVSYRGDTTISTVNGELVTHNVYIYSFFTGVWTAMGAVNSEASTGRFSGATGVLYFNGTSTDNQTRFPSDVAGEICFAPQ